MARKREEAPEKDNSERWMLTYLDFITLLMIFFVVLYAMSKVDADKFQGLAMALSKALGGGTPAKLDINGKPVGPSVFLQGTRNQGLTIKQNLDKNAENGLPKDPAKKVPGTGNSDLENSAILGIKAKLDKFAADNKLESKIISNIYERGLVVSIEDTVLFPSGSAELTPHAHEILNKISVVLSTLPNFIKVEGHTDNMPINTPLYKNNWDLSVLRATNVLDILNKEGKLAADHLSAAGYGEYRPVAPNDTELNRSKNRRVDLIILRTKYDVTEPGAE